MPVKKTMSEKNVRTRKKLRPAEPKTTAIGFKGGASLLVDINTCARLEGRSASNLLRTIITLAVQKRLNRIKKLDAGDTSELRARLQKELSQ
tara:strand:- start:29558 stop:29833 length:276 start_codon:yes stop_codon:yes gene_type:complete